MIAENDDLDTQSNQQNSFCPRSLSNNQNEEKDALLPSDAQKSEQEYDDVTQQSTKLSRDSSASSTSSLGSPHPLPFPTFPKLPSQILAPSHIPATQPSFVPASPPLSTTTVPNSLVKDPSLPTLWESSIPSIQLPSIPTRNSESTASQDFNKDFVNVSIPSISDSLNLPSLPLLNNITSLNPLPKVDFDFPVTLSEKSAFPPPQNPTIPVQELSSTIGEAPGNSQISTQEKPQEQITPEECPDKNEGNTRNIAAENTSPSPSGNRSMWRCWS